jgi:radical SAM protein with 4Fe4S-binding SPASM domain
MSRSELRTQNATISEEEFEAGAVRLTSYPKALFIELTENCNLRCLMCRSADRYEPSRNMDFALYQRIAEELFPFAELVDLRGWGESTILKRFPQYAMLAAEHGCQLRLVTNLSVSNPALLRMLVDLDFQVVVSFDASTRETFERLRPGSRFEAILANLGYLVSYARQAGKPTDAIHLNVIVQRENLVEIEGVLELAAELGLRNLSLGPIKTGPGDPNRLDHHPELVRSMLERCQERARSLDLRVQLTSALGQELALDKGTQKRCIHPWMYAYINYQGQVGFCDHLIGPRRRKYLLGDLHEDSFRDIWNNERFLDLRSRHNRWPQGLGPQFDDACNWCYQNRYIDFEPLIYNRCAEHLISTETVPRLFSARSAPSPQ